MLLRNFPGRLLERTCPEFGVAPNEIWIVEFPFGGIVEVSDVIPEARSIPGFELTD